MALMRPLNPNCTLPKGHADAALTLFPLSIMACFGPWLIFKYVSPLSQLGCLRQRGAAETA
jgi:hypothetical protein